MSLNIANILDQVVSHGLTIGYFDRVNTHEPKNAPGNGLAMAVWLDQFDTVRSSGLDEVSVKVVFNVRVMSSMLQEPQDQIDPNLILATDALITEYVGDFELGGTVRMIDIFGAYGTSLNGLAGYVEQDKKIYRLFDIKLPLIINDVWTEIA